MSWGLGTGKLRARGGTTRENANHGVMNGPIAHHQVPHFIPRRPADQIGNPCPRSECNRTCAYRVPGTEAALPVTVVGSVRDEANIDGCASAATNALAALLHRDKRIEVVGGRFMPCRRKACREERFVESRCLAHPAGSSIAMSGAFGCALPPHRQRWRDHDTQERRGALCETNCDAPERMPMNEVRRAIEGIDKKGEIPLASSRLSFFRNDGNPGGERSESFHDEGFASPVELGNQIVSCFEVGVRSRAMTPEELPPRFVGHSRSE